MVTAPSRSNLSTERVMTPLAPHSSQNIVLQDLTPSPTAPPQTPEPGARICAVSQCASVRPCRTVQGPHHRRLDIGACLGVKHIGKPCTGEPYARFDEGGLATVTMGRLVRHRQTKGAATDRPNLTSRDACSLLYPTSVPNNDIPCWNWIRFMAMADSVG
jgi:hypothetical protein